MAIQSTVAHNSTHAAGGADAITPADIGAVAASEKGAVNGIATLDASAKLAASQLPDLAISDFLGAVANEAGMLAKTGQKGDWVTRSDDGKVYVITGDAPAQASSWTALSYPVASTQQNADWNAASGVAQILNKPSLGTAAATDASAYATAAQGTKADAASQPGHKHNELYSPDGIKHIELKNNGDLTLPHGGKISDSATAEGSLTLTPPNAGAGQGLVVRPTVSTWSITSSGNIVYGSPITISVGQLSNGNYFGTVNYSITGSGVTQASLGRALTGSVVFSGTGPETETITWTIPANSDITEFTLTITGIDGERSTDISTENNPALYYNFEYNGLPTNQFVTVTNNGTSNSEHSHVHLISADPSTVDIYLGDDDQYVKIERNAGGIVIGNNSNTKQWNFKTDGTLELPSGGDITQNGTSVLGGHFQPTPDGDSPDEVSDAILSKPGIGYLVLEKGVYSDNTPFYAGGGIEAYRGGPGGAWLLHQNYDDVPGYDISIATNVTTYPWQSTWPAGDGVSVSKYEAPRILGAPLAATASEGTSPYAARADHVHPLPPPPTLAEIGAAPAGNYVTLNSSGKISSTQLPSYVDDVVEFNDLSQFPKITYAVTGSTIAAVNGDYKKIDDYEGYSSYENDSTIDQHGGRYVIRRRPSTIFNPLTSQNVNNTNPRKWEIVDSAGTQVFLSINTQFPGYWPSSISVALSENSAVTGKIYVARDSNKCYRWSGSSYIEISNSLELSLLQIPDSYAAIGLTINGLYGELGVSPSMAINQKTAYGGDHPSAGYHYVNYDAGAWRVIQVGESDESVVATAALGNETYPWQADWTATIVTIVRVGLYYPQFAPAPLGAAAYSGVGSKAAREDHVHPLPTPAAIGAANAVHKSSHATGGADALTPTDIGAAASTHAHGNITSAGAIGTTSGVPIITGASGVLQAGSFGTAAGTFAQGNHTHGSITTAGAIGTTSGVPIITGASGVLQAGSFGTAAGTFAQGNHAHGNITTAGAIGSASGVPVITGASGVLQAGSFGTAAGTFCQGNDSRFESKLNLSSSSYIIAVPGDNIAAKYALAKSLTPNGAQKSATNRACLIILPGEYSLPSYNWSVDTEFVDVIGLGAQVQKPAVFFMGFVQGFSVSANNVRVSGIEVGGAFQISGENPLQVFENCVGGLGSFGNSASANGTYINCVGGMYSFCGNYNPAATANGTFINCKAGMRSFGDNLSVGGVFKDCEADWGSFGGWVGFSSGTFINCKATYNSFGGSGRLTGKFKNCELTTSGYSFGALASPTTGKAQMINCIDGNGNIIEGEA